MLKLDSIRFVLILAALPALLASQTGVVGGPALGYVLDGGSGIRAIQGIPGASLLGRRVPLGLEMAAAEVSPRQDYVLAVAAADGTVAVVELGAATLAPRPVPGASPAPDRLILSPTGRAALLVYGRAGSAQILTGLPSDIAVAPLDLASLPEAPGALAVSDDGTAVLASTAAGLFAIVKGEARALPSAGAVSALAFTPGAMDALAAGPGHVSALSSIGGQPAWRTLATLPEDAGTPLAVATAVRRALVAVSGAVIAVDLESGAATKFPCAGVTGLAPLSGEAFRLTEMSGDPLWLIDGGGAEPRLLFIPPAAPASEEVTR